MNAALVRHYITRASDFHDGMRQMLGGPYRSSPALLAIHSAISFSDALRSGLGDQKLYGDDHAESLRALRGLLLSRRYKDDVGLLHLRYLLSVKTPKSYGPKRLDAKELSRITTKAEQFATWAIKAGNQLGIEGWSNHDQ
jgi:hypothetical protein